MALWGKVDQANNKPKFDNGSDVLGITAAEASVPGIEHAGWVKAKVGTGPVASITIVDGGTGYSNNAALIFSGGGGTGAAGTVQVTNGVITGVTLTSGGSGYTSAPTVSVAGGTGANLVAVMGGRAGRTEYETLVAMGSLANP